MGLLIIMVDLLSGILNLIASFFSNMNPLILIPFGFITVAFVFCLVIRIFSKS